MLSSFAFSNKKAYEQNLFKMKKIHLIVILALSINHAFGQRIRIGATKPSKAIPIKLNKIHEMVKNLADSIEVNYIDIKKASILKEKLLTELKEGKLDNIKEKYVLARHLSNALKKWSNDKHFNITLAGQRRMMPSSYDHFAKQNYFFEKIERLDGNIAYIKFDRFIPPSNAGSLVISAMLFAANSNAVIIDLRENMGGSPDTVGLLAGFFMKKSTLLNINDFRDTGERYETWSAETEVIINSTNHKISTSDLKKLKNLPIYILTSKYTFSAAELFSSALQGHKRAKIVGEKTGGGGHGIRPFKISQGFQAFIPFMRSYHPVTKKGWEAIGIQPDIPSSKSNALRIARISILNELLKEPNHDPKIADYLKELKVKVSK